MTDEEKVVFILFNNNECNGVDVPWVNKNTDDGCDTCPLKYSKYCMFAGDEVTLIAKAWLFDQVISKQNASEIYNNWKAKQPKNKIDRNLPDGCAKIWSDNYKHNMPIRVFIKNHQNKTFDEINKTLSLFFHAQQLCWYIKSAERYVEHGFLYFSEIGWCHAIYKNGQALSDILILTTEIKKPAHQNKSFRKLKT